MTDIQTLADQMYSRMTTATRDNGETFHKLEEGSPEWMTEVAHAAHGDMMPDDWRYARIASALELLAEGDDPDDGTMWADGACDVYHGDLTDWLASHGHRAGYCDDAKEEIGASGDIMSMIQFGQYMEAREIWDLLVGALQSHLDTLEEDETEEGEDE